MRARRYRKRRKGGRIVFVTVAVLLAWFFLFESDDRPGGENRVQAANTVRIEAIEAAAGNGDPNAQYRLGELYQRGHDVPRDPEKAVFWYREAAKRFQYDAQFALGSLYETGDGGRVDYLKAAQWYELAARLGHHADSAFALGQLYFHGRGLPQNPSEAVKWYRLAAERGHAAAQYVIGYIYETGWGVVPDSIEAYKWYTLATSGRQEALAVDRRFDPETARRNLAGKMTRFDRSEAEERAWAWRPESDEQPVIRPGVDAGAATLPAR